MQKTSRYSATVFLHLKKKNLSRGLHQATIHMHVPSWVAVFHLRSLSYSQFRAERAKATEATGDFARDPTSSFVFINNNTAAQNRSPRLAGCNRLAQ